MVIILPDPARLPPPPNSWGGVYLLKYLAIHNVKLYYNVLNRA